MMVMVGAGLAAAILYGAAAAIEHRQAERVPAGSAGKLSLLAKLARNPLWLLGFGAQFAGFAVHAVALRSGPLATVQMLIATELIVAVLLVQVWSGRKPTATSSAAALTVVAGIGAFLAATTTRGHAGGSAYRTAQLTPVAAIVLGLAAAVILLAGLRAAGQRRAILLALAAGAGDACSAVVTMAFTHVVGHGLPAVMTSWTTYAVIVAGIANILLTQTAYQAGQPLITLPLISAIVPVASVAVGVGLLGEAPRVGLAGGVGAAIAVLVTSAALAVLARSAQAQPVPAQPAPRQPAPPQPALAQPALAQPAPAQRVAGQRISARGAGSQASPAELARTRATATGGRTRPSIVRPGSACTFPQAAEEVPENACAAA